MYNSLKRRLKEILDVKSSNSEILLQPLRDSMVVSTKLQGVSYNDMSKETLNKELEIIHEELQQISSQIYTSNKKVENVKALLDEMKTKTNCELHHTREACTLTNIVT